MSQDWRDPLTKHLQEEHSRLSYCWRVIARLMEMGLDHHRARHVALHTVYVCGHDHEPGSDLSVTYPNE